MADRAETLPCRLSVNLNKVALLRNSRRSGVPPVARFAEIALEAGATGVTVHPRPDARHIRADDVRDLAMLVRRWPGRELNIEGRPTAAFLALVDEVRPHQCTLVPDAPDVLTSDRGWDFVAERASLTEAVRRLSAIGRVILFCDPSPEGLGAVPATGATGVEIYTGAYADAFRSGDPAAALAAIVRTAQAARRHDLFVHGGHDLNLANLPPLLEACRFEELSIGHELTADALEYGFEAAVRRYLSVTRGPNG